MRAAHDPLPYDSRASFQRGCVSLEKVVFHPLGYSLSQFERRIKPKTKLQTLKKTVKECIFALETGLRSITHMAQARRCRRSPKFRLDPAIVPVNNSAKYVSLGPTPITDEPKHRIFVRS